MTSFRKNYHIAKRCSSEKVKRWIDHYNKKYPTPKYLIFIKDLLDDDWQVKIYEARVSKYVFCLKNDQLFKVRFSNHKPLYEKEIENDCDFYVGISHTAVHTTDQILKILKEKIQCSE